MMEWHTYCTKDAGFESSSLSTGTENFTEGEKTMLELRISQSSQISQSIICSRRWSSCVGFDYP